MVTVVKRTGRDAFRQWWQRRENVSKALKFPARFSAIWRTSSGGKSPLGVREPTTSDIFEAEKMDSSGGEDYGSESGDGMGGIG